MEEMLSPWRRGAMGSGVFLAHGDAGMRLSGTQLSGASTGKVPARALPGCLTPNLCPAAPGRCRESPARSLCPAGWDLGVSSSLVLAVKGSRGRLGSGQGFSARSPGCSSSAFEALPATGRGSPSFPLRFAAGSEALSSLTGDQRMGRHSQPGTTEGRKGQSSGRGARGSPAFPCPQPPRASPDLG